MGLAAIGAGIAVLTGLGAGIGIGVATNGAPVSYTHLTLPTTSRV